MIIMFLNKGGGIAKGKSIVFVLDGFQNGFYLVTCGPADLLYGLII